MSDILVIGAGRSASTLIKYLAEYCVHSSSTLTIADLNFELAKEKCENHEHCTPLALDIADQAALDSAIEGRDVVVSMVPAHMHLGVAKTCLAHGTHMVTASYLTPEMLELDGGVKEKNLVFLNECGLDPGIDHMSAMKLLDELRDQGAVITLFESFTGGLVSPESEGDNPWRYKFTWNPRNVVLAGQGGAVKFIQEGKYKYIPPHQVFRRTELLEVAGLGTFEGLANRDSLKYTATYGLDDVHTMYRGTLRRPGFARAWDVFVKLGMTDDSYTIENTNELTFREFTNLFLAYNPHDSVELKLWHYLGIPQDSELIHKLKWIGLFSNDTFPFERATPAKCLEYLLSQKWTLEEDDIDMIVMLHKVGYIMNGEEKMIQSTLAAYGDDQVHTAMSKTVGLPLAIAVENLLDHRDFYKPGVQLPTTKEWYNPILMELADSYDFRFVEEELE